MFSASILISRVFFIHPLGKRFHEELRLQLGQHSTIFSCGCEVCCCHIVSICWVWLCCTVQPRGRD
jgi:hypothetical protein